MRIGKVNINAIDELERELCDIGNRLNSLKNSPNRAFVLIEYDTLSSFHFFNLFLKKFWDEFDHSASQLLLFKKFMKTHSQLSDKYVALLREQIEYLDSVIDVKNKCLNYLPPVIFVEDNTTDVLGYYLEYFKNDKDDNGEPLYQIETESGDNFEIINGKEIPVTPYMFSSNIINDVYYDGLYNMYRCLNNIYGMIGGVLSYPESLLSGYNPSEHEIVEVLEHELRQHAKEDGQSIYRELRKIFLELKRSNSNLQPSDVWAQVLELESDAFRLAISGKLVENNERLFDHYDEDKRKLWTDNYKLLQKIKDTCIDDELFDIRLAVETYNLLSVLSADNLDLFYELVLRRNIIQCEMYPGLKTQYNEWLNPSKIDKTEDYKMPPMHEDSEEGVKNEKLVEEELFHFIHVEIEDEEASHIHHAIKRLVANYSIPDICKYLKEQKQSGKLMLPSDLSAIYNELVRLGMPKGKGFSENHFKNSYMK